MPEKSIKKALIILIIISSLMRFFLAGTIELGNDEVYYWTYALFPDLSHFDHPPMVGFVIQLFTLDLFFHSELFLRLASILLGSINCWLVFLIGRQIKNSLTGLYAAFLYSFSIYGFIITGIFILPDTPQMFFWFLSLLFILKTFSCEVINKESRTYLLLSGIFTGLALLSKYTSIFLLIGMFFYILLFDRKWLKSYALYVSVLITFIAFIPVIIWNFRNNFISITFQGERVDILESSIRLDYFVTEILGQLLYNNPVNYFLLIGSFAILLKNKIIHNNKLLKLLLSAGLPMILLFTFFSAFRKTLPHWSSPGFTTLLFIPANYLADFKKLNMLFPSWMKASGILLLGIIIIGYLQIQNGLIKIPQPKGVSASELGRNDLSLEIFGWKQIGDGFTEILKRDLNQKLIGSNPAMISYRWFPAANLDYYVAFPNKIPMLAIGSVNNIHKYYWINQLRGGFYKGMDAYYITTSYDYHEPNANITKLFETSQVTDTIKIIRNGTHVMNAFVYRMRNMKTLPEIGK